MGTLGGGAIAAWEAIGNATMREEKRERDRFHGMVMVLDLGHTNYPTTHSPPWATRGHASLGGIRLKMGYEFFT